MRALMITVLVLAGCANPDDIFPIHGRVESKTQVEGVTIEVFRQTQSADGGFDLCHFEDLEPIVETTTDGDGAYRFELFRAQTQNLASFNPYCFRVRARFASGSECAVDLRQVIDSVAVPPLIDWQPNMRLENGVLKYEPAIADLDFDVFAERSVMHRSSFRTAGDEVRWQADDLLVLDGGESTIADPAFTAERVEMAYPGDVFEDFSGTVRLEARVVYPGNRMSSVPLTSPPFTGTMYVTPAQSLDVTGNRVPLSRGLTRQPDGGVEVDFPVPTAVRTLNYRAAKRTLPSLTAFQPRSLEVVAKADGGVVTRIDVPIRTSVWDRINLERIFDVNTGTVEIVVPAVWVTATIDAGQPVDSVTVTNQNAPPEDDGVSLF